MDTKKIQSRRWFILLLMGVVIMIAVLQNTMINVGLPSLQADFGADATSTQWFVNAYVLAFAGLLLLMGALGDKFGRKLLLNLGLIVFGAGSLWAVVAGSSNELIASQVLMGAGAAMITPQSLSIIVDVFKAKERKLAIAIWTGLAALGAGLGTLIGGLLLENYSVDSLFYVNLPFLAIALIFGWFIVPESKKSNYGKVDVVGAVLSLLAVVALITAFIWVPEHGWLGLYTLGAFLVAVVTGSMFVAYERVFKNPLLDMKFFNKPDFVDGITGNTVVFFSLMGLFFIVAQFLQILGQKSALDAGLLMLPMLIGIVLASVLGQKFADKFGSRKTVVYGILATTAGLLLVSLWRVDVSDWVVALTLTIIGLGAGAAIAPATNDIMKQFTGKTAGMGSSVTLLARQVSGAIGIAVLGAVLNGRYADQLAAYVAGAPADIAERITGSIQGAYELATEFALQGQQAITNSVITTTNAAFMVGLSAAIVIAVIVTIVLTSSINRETPKN